MSFLKENDGKKVVFQNQAMIVACRTINSTLPSVVEHMQRQQMLNPVKYQCECYTLSCSYETKYFLI